MPEYEIPNGIGWEPSSEQRTYQPPAAPPAPFEPPPVNASARQFKGTPFEQALAAMTHAQNEYQRHVSSVNENRHHYTDDGYRAQIAAFQDTSAYKAIDQHVEQVQHRHRAASERAAKVIAELSPDGDTAAELRATRYWNRTKAMLDAADDDGQLIHRARELINSANPTELGTLLQELEPYCTARGATTGWIDASIGEAAPRYGQAKTELRKADQAVTMASANARMLTDAIAQGSQVPIRLATPTRAGDYDPDK